MITFSRYLLVILAIIRISSGSGICQNNPVKIKPLIKDLFTADPSAHVFNGKIYIYPSHDIEANVPEDDEGGHFNMRDYHIFSMDKINGKRLQTGANNVQTGISVHLS